MASDSIIDGCEPPNGCWDLNSGLLEEQPVLRRVEKSVLGSQASVANNVGSETIPYFCSSFLGGD